MTKRDKKIINTHAHLGIMASIHTKIALKNNHPHPSTSLEWSGQTLALTLCLSFSIIKLFSLNFKNLLVIYTRPFSSLILHHPSILYTYNFTIDNNKLKSEIFVFPKKWRRCII